MNIKFVKYYIGLLIRLEGFMMLIPIIPAIIYKEHVGILFLIISLITIFIGFLLCLEKPKDNIFFASESFVVVALGWLLFSFFGALPFFFSQEIPNFIDCMLETISGFTTSGITIINDVEIMSRTMLFWRSFTHLVGGMGVLVLMLCILPTQSDNMLMMKAEATGIDVSRFMPHVKDTALILYKIYLFLTLITIICYVLSGMPIFDSICIAFGTAGTGGFSVLNTSCATYGRLSQTLIAIFMLVFGVNFNIYFMILLKQFGYVKKSEELRWYIIIVLSSIVLITINVVNALGDDIVNTLHDSFFNVATIISTAGFAANDHMRWPIFSRTILCLLMFIGGCAGSTAGGFKVSRVVVLIKEFINELRYQTHPHSVKLVKYDGKVLSRRTINTVNMYLVAYVAVFILGFLLISIDGFDFETNISAVATTFNNVGIGLGELGKNNFNIYSYFSKIVFSFLMLIGRLEIFPMIILFSKNTYRRQV